MCITCVYLAASFPPYRRAFAVVETIASAYAIETGHLYQLSPQQLISCDYNPALSLDGCRGGSLKAAFQTTRDVSSGIITVVSWVSVCERFMISTHMMILYGNSCYVHRPLEMWYIIIIPLPVSAY